MPTYEFRCPLGHEFEKFYRSIGVAQSQAACPECGQLAERMMSAGAGLVFKGSGFYLTDYGKNAHREKGTAPKSALDAGGGDAAAKPEVKAESTGSTSSEGAAAPKAAPAPATESKPAAPKKSTGE